MRYTIIAHTEFGVWCEAGRNPLRFLRAYMNFRRSGYDYHVDWRLR